MTIAGRTLTGFLRAAAGLAFVLFFNASIASAQAVNPTTVDVAGIRLGMTVDEATVALKAFDPGFTITKRYFTGGGMSFNTEGAPMDEIPVSDRPMAFLANLYAIKGAATRECRTLPPGSSAPQCVERHPDDEEVIKVWFSHVLGQERVIMVQRTKTFYKDPKPAIATLKQDVLAKYGERITFDSHNGWFETIGWFYDPKRQLMSATAVKSKGIAAVGGVPNLVRPGDGISLTVMFKGNNVTNEIADNFAVTLADGDALYRSVDESKTAYETLKARANGAAVDRARGQGQTKF